MCYLHNVVHVVYTERIVARLPLLHVVLADHDLYHLPREALDASHVRNMDRTSICLGASFP